MSRLAQIGELYRAAADIARGAVELRTVSDEAGARLDGALKRLIIRLRDEDPEVWQELMALARQLRWRLATNPAPAAFRADDEELRVALATACQHRKLGTDHSTQALLNDLVRAADHACEEDRPTGVALLDCLAKSDPGTVLVVTASGRAQGATRDWFDDLGIVIPVLRASFGRHTEVADHAYAIGWPSLFGPSLLTAPRARTITYVLPSWVRDRALPTTAFAAYAEGAIRPARKITTTGPEPVLDEPADVVVDQLAPTLTWQRHEPARALRSDEVLARKVLLGGGLAIMLDQDGEHIRSLDPAQPTGRRVEHGDVSAVTVGSYLVLREGVTQSAMLYERAIELLGSRGPHVSQSQQEWKSALQGRLDQMGTSAVIRALERAGVKRADRAPAWTAITLARPQDDQDFELLLGWLGLPRQPYFDLATALRRTRLRASQEIREILENALASADLAELECDGFLRIELDDPGFRGMIATRVLAISPELEPVSRHEIRLPRKDWQARWLA
jgi:hypothetical protein